MRLLIHNMLMSRVKGVKKGYPFGIKVVVWCQRLCDDFARVVIGCL